MPHALAVSADGMSLFVGEIGPNRVWKFKIGGSGAGAGMTMTGHDDHGEMKSPPTAKPIKKPELTKETSLASEILKRTSTPQLVLIIGSIVIVPLVLICAIFLCIKFKRQGKIKE